MKNKKKNYKQVFNPLTKQKGKGNKRGYCKGCFGNNKLIIEGGKK